MENKKLQIAKNSIYAFGSTSLRVVFGLILSVIIARMLGPSQMGIYSYIGWLVGIFVTIANLGLPTSLIKYVAEYKEKKEFTTISIMIRKILKFETIISFGLIIIFILSSLIFIKNNKDSLMLIYFILASFWIFPEVLNNIMRSTTYGLQKFNVQTIVRLIILPLTLFFSLLVLIFGFGILGLLIVNILVCLLELFIFILLLRKHLFINTGNHMLPQDLWARIKHYSISVIGITIIDTIVWQKSEIFFLGLFCNTKEIAYYNISFTFSLTSMQFLPRVLGSVSWPIFSGFYGTKDLKGLSETYSTFAKYISMLAIPIGVGGCILAKQIIVVTCGESYLPAVLPLQILFIVSSISTVLGNQVLLYATERQSFMLKYGVVVAFMNIVLDIILIQKYGSLGAAIGVSITYLISSIVEITYIVKSLKMKPPLGSFLRITIASIIMGIVIFPFSRVFSNFIGLILLLIMGAFVNFITLLLLRELNWHSIIEGLKKLGVR